jgi:antitoxin CptB
LDVRLKRLLFRCRHRGMQETDRLLGGFAERYLGGLDDAQLGRLEMLLDQSDPDLFNWIGGKDPVPAAFDHDVMRLLRDYRESLTKP